VEAAGVAERDAWLVAQEVTWTGTAKQDLRAFAGAVRLAGGGVEGNAVAGGRGVRMDAGARVEGDLLVAAQQATLDGEVAGGTWIWAGEAVLGGTFGGDVRVHADKLRLKPGAVIKGRLTADVAEPFAVTGDVEVGEIRWTRQPSAPDWRTALKARARFAGLFYLAMLLAGWLYAWMFPVRAAMGSANLGRSPFKSFFAGLAGLVVAWVVAVAGMGSAVGIPLALAVLGLTAVFAVAALPVAGLWVGRLVFRGAGPERAPADFIRNMAAGLLVLSLLGLALGRWGATVLLAFWMMGYGALVASLFQRPRIVRAPAGPGAPQGERPQEPPEDGEGGGGGA
jgi:cytoskeletal protein CcmA (bactofilin family)